MNMKCRLLMLIFISHVTVVHNMTCDEIRQMPPDKKLSLDELKTAKPKEIVQCLAHLGKEQIGTNEAEFIWKTIVSFYEGVMNVPEKMLMLLHWVTPAIPPEDYSNITFNNIEVIQNFGLNYNLNNEQLSAIADRIREDFAGKEPEDYTYYDLTALRQILCVFNRSEIERIHPQAYREAAVVIGKLKNCPAEPMLGFATLAVQRSAFGPPKTWSQNTLDIIGVVAEFLPKEIINKIREVRN